MKRFIGALIVCSFVSISVFAENATISTPTPQKCDLKVLKEEKDKLVAQKKEIVQKIVAVKKEIRHCKGPGKISKQLMEENKVPPM